MIIIGSTAIKKHFPDFPREPKDLDYVLFEYQRFDVMPVKGIEYLHNKVLSDLYHKSGSSDIPEKQLIDKDHLCTLKASHLCWDINWEKHMFDLQFLLKKGCKIDKDLFFKLYNFWNEYHSKNKRSDLKMSKDEFFTNAINYDIMEHDDLHLLINPVPTYTKVLKDGCEVELDEKKFYALSFEEKLDFVREEVYVMAYERWKHVDFRMAYSRMLKKFIMNHAPTFSLIFIFENYIELHKPKINFIQTINKQLN